MKSALWAVIPLLALAACSGSGGKAADGGKDLLASDTGLVDASADLAPDKSAAPDKAVDQAAAPDKKPLIPDLAADQGQCKCIPEKDWGQWRTCNCPQVKWGCVGASQIYSGICDLKPECWDVMIDKATGCPRPTTKCSKSCLSSDLFIKLDQGPDIWGTGG